MFERWEVLRKGRVSTESGPGFPREQPYASVAPLPARYRPRFCSSTVAAALSRSVAATIRRSMPPNTS